ncbi:MAG TPA: helix-turn-helix domain-containing protein [Acidimicrobiales bacterium]|nr:helix-turn-helix domain-containing protein [Acidimicrobiales bacterium]
MAPTEVRVPAAEAGAGRTNSRSALLRAAVEVFTERGYEAATVADIAERAGVTTGALYAHFGGKLDLLLQSLGFKSVEEFARDSLAGVTDPQEEAAILGRGLAKAPSGEAILLLDVIVTARRDRQLADRTRRLLTVKIDELAAAVRRAADGGFITPVLSPTDLARLVTVISLGKLVMAAIDEPLPSDDAFVELVEALAFPSAEVGRRDHSSGGSLAEVAYRAAKLGEARAGFEAAVRAGSRSGLSLRRLAEASGVSHERIRRILRQP